MASALDSATSIPGPRPGRTHRVVFLVNVFIMGYVTSFRVLCDTLSQCFISGPSVYVLRCLHLYSFESYDRLFAL